MARVCVPELDDAVLGAALERAQRGDAPAFETLVRHYDPGLRALTFRLLGDRDRMDDALQEAYVKAFRALPGFRNESSFGTWLYRIAYNACLDELERSRRVVRLPFDEREYGEAEPALETDV
jgi:RNA polymerase sigma-70 factor, ECF subfamily